MMSGQEFSDMVMSCHDNGYAKIFVSGTTFIDIKKLVKDDTEATVINVVDRETKAPMLLIEAYEIIDDTDLVKAMIEQFNIRQRGEQKESTWSSHKSWNVDSYGFVEDNDFNSFINKERKKYGYKPF